MMVIAVASYWRRPGSPGPGLESCLVGRCGLGYLCAGPVAPAGVGTLVIGLPGEAGGVGLEESGHVGHVRWVVSPRMHCWW